MRMYYLFFIIFLIISTYVIGARRFCIKKETSCTTYSDNQTADKPIIIFDLINILFKESYTGFAQKIGYATLTSYALTHWKNPGHRCLDMLEGISNNPLQKPHVAVTIDDRTMPRCIVELHEGKKTCDQTKNEILSAIEQLDKDNFFTSIKEKNLMCSIMNLMLDPLALPSITEPIKPTITLAQKLKNNGYQLYLLANVPQEFYSALEKKYPEIIQLFNGVTISSRVKQVKPQKEIFEHMITTHKLIPEQCILIDQAQNNIQSARNVGMRTIMYDKITKVIADLKKHGVIIE